MSLSLSGKWCRVERFDVPEEYLRNLLSDMPGASLNTIEERRHWRPPIWKPQSKVLCYRSHDIEDVFSAFGKQSAVNLCGRKATDSAPLRGRQALEAAKARSQFGSANRSPTSRSELVVGYGEGRMTREFDLLWWPELFSNGNRGKLVIRFYISKVLI